jgi:hypothetical protein
MFKIRVILEDNGASGVRRNGIAHMNSQIVSLPITQNGLGKGGGRSLPETITLMPFLTPTPEYEFVMNPHDVAMKMRVSCIKGQIDDSALGSFIMI